MNQTVSGRRLALLAALLVASVICLILFFWERPSLTEESDNPTKGTQTASERPRSNPAQGAPNESTDGATTVSSTPISPAEEALRATLEHSGDGWVRCTLPEGLPELDLIKLKLASLKNGFLSMATENPNGALLLPTKNPMPERPEYLSQPSGTTDHEDNIAAMDEFLEDMADWVERSERPAAFIQWDGAEPGQRGHCRVNTSEQQIEMKVWVKRKDGQPATDMQVASTHFSEGVPTNEQGLAVVSAWEQMQTTLWALTDLSVNDPDYHRNEAQITVMATAGKQIILVLSAKEPSASDDEVEDMENRHDSKVASLQEALKNPGLSEAAKEQLQDWIDKFTESHENFLDTLDALDDAKAAVGVE